MRSTTIRDVAAAASVSIATVSRALSSPELVAPATRDRVRSVARELGYHSSRSGRFASADARTIALLVPDLENPFFGQVAKGVQARARSDGLLVAVCDTDEDPMLERAVLETVVSQVDALILCSPRGPDETILAAAAQLPTALANREVEGLPSVQFDEDRGVTASLRHLVALGHRRIAYAGGPPASWTQRRRSSAVRRFAAHHPECRVLDLGPFQPYLSGGAGAAQQAIDAGVTAVVAFNDLLALGIIGHLTQQGLRVPEDMSVSGIDNVAAATHVRPHLTTVDVPRVQMGRTAVDLVLGAMRRESPPAPQKLPAELIVRDSTAVAPAPVAGAHAPTAVAPAPAAATPTSHAPLPAPPLTST
ncbi:LacI family transcriptional regulator [Brachybacterium endophyticum]|uniref:LacI family transcriptional regulator n=1 Tax=Brachybacterium endophyticum TaxID=2182385 RepID=A0A2U2RNJ2_9MICO|nr:LacI family DNA-binding transcriptional regulator [Brachybacterium endophyticum]PWH07440.1 LacI family transcriptional regulator [Brachybacterium endophyticum]